jgi:hypothetical protein
MAPARIKGVGQECPTHTGKTAGGSGCFSSCCFSSCAGVKQVPPLRRIIRNANNSAPFAEKIAGVLGKYFLPELSEALGQKGSGDMDAEVNKKVGFTTGAAKTPFANAQDSEVSGDFSLDPIGNSPITRQTNHTGNILRFLLTLLAVVAVMYLFLRHR